MRSKTETEINTFFHFHENGKEITFPFPETEINTFFHFHENGKEITFPFPETEINTFFHFHENGKEITSGFLPFFHLPKSHATKMETETTSTFLPFFHKKRKNGKETTSNFHFSTFLKMEKWKETTSDFRFRKRKDYLSKEITFPFPSPFPSRVKGGRKHPPMPLAFAGTGKPFPRKTKTIQAISIKPVPLYLINMDFIMNRKWMKNADYMPELKHGYPESDCIEWIKTQNELLYGLWDLLRENRRIIYDPDTKTWKGSKHQKGAS